MLFGYPIWAVALVCIGVFAASFVDAIGGGGGIISVPVYLFAGLPTHLALGTNKLSAGIGTIASAYRYIRSGYIRWSLAAVSVVLAVVGASFGTQMQLMVDERYLKYMLLLVLPVVAVVLLKEKKLPEEQQPIHPWLQRGIVWGASFVIGIYDGFYGPGTGTFLLLVYCHLGKMDVRTASGNVKAVNLASNIGALVTSLVAGKVIVPLGLLAAAFSVTGAYLGAGLTIKNGTKVVRPVLFAVLGMLAVKVLLELLGV